jgi:hypothetical protein
MEVPCRCTMARGVTSTTMLPTRAQGCKPSLVARENLLPLLLVLRAVRGGLLRPRSIYPF